MVAFYNQGDQEIYEGGQHYIPQEQYRLGKFSNTVAPMPMDGTQQITQEFGIPYTGAFTNSGGVGPLNKYGIDTSKGNMKMVDVQQWDGSSWVTDKIPAYNVSGGWKTAEGKNIAHGGHFTGDPDEGDIKGTPFQFPSMFAMLKKMKEKFTGGQASQTDIDAANKEQAQNIGATTVAPQHQQEQGGGGYQDTPTHSAKEAMAEGIDVGAGGMMGPGGKHYADGGRIGYKKGGRQDQMGGTMEQTAQELREAAPDQFAGGMNISHGGGGDGNNQGNTGGISQLVDTDLMRTDPSIELNYDFKKLPLYLQAKLHNKNLLTEDNINLEGQVGGSIGPVDWSSYFDQEGVTGSNVGMGPFEANIDPNKNIRNISFDQDLGNFNFQGNTDLENYGLGVNYNQEGGPFFAGGSMDNMGNKNFNVGAKWEFGQPENYNTTSWQDENPDLIYGLKYGGLASIL